MKSPIYLLLSFVFLFGNFTISYTQNTESQLNSLNNRLKTIESEKDSLLGLLEFYKSRYIIERLNDFGNPKALSGEQIICHTAMCMVFSEEYRLAKWVAHIITADIVTGRVGRSNDFRPDPKIPNTGVEQDYFLKYPLGDGRYKYDGFGYDRGHLAPSADFRWSETALSESYYYSNITPQSAELNREKWAEIEDFLRTYIYNNRDNKLFVVTGPVLQKDLPVIEKGVHKLPIPKYHYKVAVDYDKKIGIAFLVPQKDLIYPIDAYVVTIDSVEALTGINFYPKLNAEDEKRIESQSDLLLWNPPQLRKDVHPILREELPLNAFNTIEARKYIDYHREVKICGQVVSAHKSGKGNVFLNLDKAFPNQIFSVTIWSKNVLNFDYAPEQYLIGKTVCVTGKITEYQGIPSMYLSNEKKIEILR